MDLQRSLVRSLRYLLRDRWRSSVRGPVIGDSGYHRPANLKRAAARERSTRVEVLNSMVPLHVTEAASFCSRPIASVTRLLISLPPLLAHAINRALAQNLNSLGCLSK